VESEKSKRNRERKEKKWFDDNQGSIVEAGVFYGLLGMLGEMDEEGRRVLLREKGHFKITLTVASRREVKVKTRR
jgi:hypothetical protein